MNLDLNDVLNYMFMLKILIDTREINGWNNNITLLTKFTYISLYIK